MTKGLPQRRGDQKLEIQLNGITLFHCPSYDCHMTRKACGVNQHMARKTAQQVLSGDETIFTLPESNVSRMLVCGWCPGSTASKADAKRAFRKSADLLLSKIEGYNEWGADPEVARIKARARSRAWRNANPETVKTNRAAQYQTVRIEQLRRLWDGKDT